MTGDGSRTEAAATGAHHERTEADLGGLPRGHVTAADALPADGSGEAPGPALVRATPPGPADLFGAALVALITVAALVAVGLAIARAG